jgi:hypothetical protein
MSRKTRSPSFGLNVKANNVMKRTLQEFLLERYYFPLLDQGKLPTTYYQTWPWSTKVP